jgi:hypothetical protein
MGDEVCYVTASMTKGERNPQRAGRPELCAKLSTCRSLHNVTTFDADSAVDGRSEVIALPVLIQNMAYSFLFTLYHHYMPFKKYTSNCFGELQLMKSSSSSKWIYQIAGLDEGQRGIAMNEVTPHKHCTTAASKRLNVLHESHIHYNLEPIQILPLLLPLETGY